MHHIIRRLVRHDQAAIYALAPSGLLTGVLRGQVVGVNFRCHGNLAVHAPFKDGPRSGIRNETRQRLEPQVPGGWKLARAIRHGSRATSIFGKPGAAIDRQTHGGKSLVSQPGAAADAVGNGTRQVASGISARCWRSQTSGGSTATSTSVQTSGSNGPLSYARTRVTMWSIPGDNSNHSTHNPTWLHSRRERNVDRAGDGNDKPFSATALPAPGLVQVAGARGRVSQPGEPR